MKEIYTVVHALIQLHFKHILKITPLSFLYKDDIFFAVALKMQTIDTEGKKKALFSTVHSSTLY